METLLLPALTGLICLLAGGAAGFYLFGKRFYNQGYEDGVDDGKAEKVALSGACGDCGWETDYDEISAMLQQIIQHVNDCPARRY